NLDTITVLQSLRRSAPDCAIVLLVSTEDEAAHLRQMMGLSADAVFSRPLSHSEVFDRIKALLALHGWTDVELPHLSSPVSRMIELFGERYSERIRLQEVAREV